MDPNATCKNGIPYFFRIHDETILKKFIENGADINMRDHEGMTFLMDISKNYPIKTSLIKFLVNHGADIDLKCNNNMTAFDYAIENDKNGSTLDYFMKFDNISDDIILRLAKKIILLK